MNVINFGFLRNDNAINMSEIRFAGASESRWLFAWRRRRGGMEGAPDDFEHRLAEEKIYSARYEAA